MEPADPAHLKPAAPRFAWLSREVRILSAVNFVSAVGFGIQSPTIPVFALELGVGTAMVGMIIAAFAFGRTVTNIPAGRLVDRAGARRVIGIGLALLALGSLLAGVSQSGWQLAGFRGVCGVGSALYSVSAMALLVRSTASSHRGRVVGVFMGAFYVGATTGPALGAAMAGLSPRVPFFIYAAGVAGCAFFVWPALRHPHILPPPPAASAAVGRRVDWGWVFRQRDFLSAFLCNLGIGWAAYGVRVSVLPLFLLQVIEEDEAWIGLALALGAAVQAVMLPLAGSITDRVGRRIALVGGQGLMVLAYGLVLGFPVLWAYLTCFAVMAVGTALCVTAGSALVGDVIKGVPQGGAMLGAYSMAADVGTMAGAVITGWLAQHLSYGAGWMGTLAVLAIGLGTAAFLRPRPAVSR